MLETLEIHNIALIENETIDFDNGLNVLTGETGAGKSLIIDAIGILLGNKVTRSLIKSGETSCKVIGKFFIENYVEQEFLLFCKKYGINQNDNEVIISRTFSQSGKNDIRINGEMSTLSTLKELSSILVDAHFQNDNQKIFSTDEHLKILDNFAQTTKTKDFQSYIDSYEKLQQINSKLLQYGQNSSDRLTKIDILSYQSKELSDANISQNEYDDLQTKRQKYMNIGKILSSVNLAFDCIGDNCINNISRAKNELFQASNYDVEISSLADRLASAQIELDDIKDSLQNYIQNSDYNEDEMQKIEDRLDIYHKLFRKYGSTVSEILKKQQSINKELDLLQNSANTIDQLEKEKNIILKNLYDIANKIEQYRKKYALSLCQQITKNLHLLGMKNAVVEYDFDQSDQKKLYKNGHDKVELLFSANLGEKPKSIAKIASGGEISRFMLALKSVIATIDSTPTIIFDEIDTGISGVAVEQMAKQMANIAKSHQIIVVTHSAQICAMADINFLISKSEENKKTCTHIKRLSESEKVNEVARFLSGENLTHASKANAIELISIQNKFKYSIK